MPTQDLGVPSGTILIGKGVVVSALHLQYDVEADRLLARLQPAPHGELVQVQREARIVH